MTKEHSERTVVEVNKYNRGGGDAVYGFGLFGALVFYLQQANGFVSVMIALLKAVAWPAFAVYELLKFLAR